MDRTVPVSYKIVVRIQQSWVNYLSNVTPFGTSIENVCTIDKEATKFWTFIHKRQQIFAGLIKRPSKTIRKIDYCCIRRF